MWVNILLCATYVMYLIFNVYVDNIHEDLGADI